MKIYLKIVKEAIQMNRIDSKEFVMYVSRDFSSDLR
jgi:hypothetical protein